MAFVGFLSQEARNFRSTKKTPLSRSGVELTKRRESYENKYSFTFHELSIGAKIRLKWRFN